MVNRKKVNVKMSDNKKIMDATELIVSTKVVADILDVTPRRVGQLCEEGILSKVKNGSFKLVPTIRNFIRYLKTKNDVASATGDVEEEFNKEHMLLEKAKREKAELEVSLMKGTMHTSEDVEREMTKMLSAFRARILAMPSKLAPRVAITEDVTKIEEYIREEAYNALNELSDYDPSVFQHESYVDVEVNQDG